MPAIPPHDCTMMPFMELRQTEGRTHALGPKKKKEIISLSLLGILDPCHLPTQQRESKQGPFEFRTMSLARSSETTDGWVWTDTLGPCSPFPEMSESPLVF
ncbi:hypothetical protein FALCPG4_009245 [Fusarium falciforme]